MRFAMKNIISNILIFILKCIPQEFLVKLLTLGIARILEYARKRGGDYWDTAKCSISKIKRCCEIFEEVYEDDNLSEEDEKKIENAIRNSKFVDNIDTIIKENNNLKS